tara:strand:+ start:296 stop:454 length:159 start_codon:yes stop_codon:yes gene_type:complete
MTLNERYSWQDTQQHGFVILDNLHPANFVVSYHGSADEAEKECKRMNGDNDD